MKSGFRLGRIAGIEVFVDWSLLIIFVVIALSLATGLFPAWHPNWTAAVAWVTALAAAVLFFASVLIHELSHALVGRLRGVTIGRITLFIFGGMAQMQDEPRTWGAEFWMAIVGPLTSLALGVLFLVLASLLSQPVALAPGQAEHALASLGPVATLLYWLGPVNIILGLFNLVPGFPLDGGRVLRAVMWAISGNFRKATRWASRAGQGFAWLLILTGLSMIMGLQVPVFGGGFINGLWLAFIGWFLNNAALMSYQQLLVREALSEVPVSRLMQTDVVTVERQCTLHQLIDEHLAQTNQRAFPVLDRGRFVGLVSLSDIRKRPRAEWERTTVGDIMTPADQVTVIGPQRDSADALVLLAQRNLNQLPVVESNELRGLIRRQDILRWLSVYGGDLEA